VLIVKAGVVVKLKRGGRPCSLGSADSWIRTAVVREPTWKGPGVTGHSSESRGCPRRIATTHRDQEKPGYDVSHLSDQPGSEPADSRLRDGKPKGASETVQQMTNANKATTDQLRRARKISSKGAKVRDDIHQPIFAMCSAVKGGGSRWTPIGILPRRGSVRAAEKRPTRHDHRETLANYGGERAMS